MNKTWVIEGHRDGSIRIWSSRGGLGHQVRPMPVISDWGRVALYYKGK